MVTSRAVALMDAFRRVGLWFSSLLIAVTFFTFLLSLLLGRGEVRFESVFLVLRVTLLFALPA